MAIPILPGGALSMVAGVHGEGEAARRETAKSRDGDFYPNSYSESP